MTHWTIDNLSWPHLPTSTAPPPRPPVLHRHAWALVLVLGVALYYAVERTLLHTQNPNFIPSLILLGALVMPVSFVVLVYGRSAVWTVTPPVLLIAAVF